MNDIILIMASYLIIIFLAIGIVAWLQAGFFGAFFKVKTSRGKKILIKIRKATGTDFVAGVEVEGQLVFKYFKEEKRLSNYKKGVYRSFNLNCIDVEPETWGVVTTDFNAISTNDPNKTDSLIERALLRPDRKATKEMIMIILLIVIVIGVLFIAYKLNFLQTSITGLGSIAGNNI